MSYYDDLGLATSASGEEITAQFRALARQVHPDRGGDAAVFHALTEAYDVLGDPERRRAYDAELAASERTSAAPVEGERPPDHGIPDWAHNRWVIEEVEPGPGNAFERWVAKVDRAHEARWRAIVAGAIGAALATPGALLTSEPLLTAGIVGIIAMVIGPPLAIFVRTGRRH